MSLILTSQAQRPNTIADVKRPSANYTPSIWGDHFLSYATMEVDIKLEQHVRQLKEEVKKMLMDPLKSPSQQLNLIDDIQRLGVSYHFKNEIDGILKQIHHNYSYGSEDDLYTTALRFRLLRQQGCNVSCDMFNKFKEGNDQKFKASLLSDVSGLLSLYEATHLRIHGEGILEEALSFTTTHLQSIKHSLSSSLSKEVAHALMQPLRKGINRVEARYYLSIYHERDSHNDTLLTFAKLDFNLVQKIHQKELCEVTRWWKDLDVRNTLPFTRDKATEVYFCWALSVYFEPQYSYARKISSKVTAMASIIDDIYDAHGTFEELELFTEAIQRWDVCAIDPLPDYMKVCYKALLEAYTEIEEQLAKEGKLYRIHYAREADEQKREHVTSAVECYMKEYGATEEQAIIELRRKLSDAWKDINESFHPPNVVPRALLTRIINFACVMDVVYKYVDGYSTHDDTVLKDFIVSTLVQPVPV
ncbi:putative lyase [Rosa chinensis]|uniref:Putative lyase n=1 Tax=Rosa chinensis TaxID=74649 RepID=A0A2P6QHP6_ROSCH|nr:(-)-germacrene D synthase isoform X2 [Rosa chinensis]PRQ33701.1 putative lyase [Rosa chinensis]